MIGRASVPTMQASLQVMGLWLLVFLGTLLRARQYFFNRSLWSDEAMLALNIVRRNFTGLLRPLEYGQACPLGFLYVERLFVRLFGNHDYILRLFPFLTGLAAVMVMAWLSRRLFPGWTGLAAMGFFIVSWPSIYYASEVKQYGSDVLFTLILISLATLCSGRKVPRRNWLWLLGGGSLALWMSHPALFVLMGIAVVLGISNLQEKNWRHVGWLSVASVFWAIHFLCTYVLSLRYRASAPGLVAFWNDAFMPLPPWSDWGWFLRSAKIIVQGLMHVPVVLGLGLLAVGVLCMFRRGWKTAALWLLPVLAAGMASGMKKYPVALRFLLFALPLFCFFAAAGIRALHELSLRFLPKMGYLFSIAVAMAIFLRPVALSIHRFRFPENKNDIKSVMAYLHAHRHSRDVIYVHHAKHPFLYYAGFFGIDPGGAVIEAREKESANPLLGNINKVAGHSRVWFIIGPRWEKDGFDQAKIMVEYLDRIGVQKRKYKAAKMTLYLYDLRRSSPARRPAL